MVSLTEFDFELPPDRIAQSPVRPRDAARLLCVRPGASTHRHGPPPAGPGHKIPHSAGSDDPDQPRHDKEYAPCLDDRHVRDLPDLLQPGDVLVVDIYGKQEGGTIVGDNLFHYIMRATKGGGLVVDGSIRDLEGISEIDMPAYFRSVHPSYINGVTVAAVNVPIRIGDVTVMPGDVVIGDPEGVSFVPPQLIEGIVDRADTTHIHDEWTKKKFDEGKYKSTDIYGSPHDPALIKEYQEYLAKRLEEIRKNNPK